MTITCIGSGAFSIAIASLLSKREDNKIFMWSHEEKFVIEAMKNKKLQIREKSILLPKNISLGTNLEEMAQEADILFLLVSTTFIKDIVNILQHVDLKNKRIFIGSKGLLEHTPYFYSKYLHQKLNAKSIEYFAGPNLAQDLIETTFCSITFSCKAEKSKAEIRKILPNDVILHFTKNTKALEIASTMKNIYAIGSGIIQEKTDSQSSVHAYLAQSYYELLKILNILFLMDYHLIPIDITADFYLTCTMVESRNLTYGKLLVKKKEKEFLKKNTVEGVQNLENIKLFLEKRGIKAPIFEAIYQIVSLKANIKLLEIAIRG